MIRTKCEGLGFERRALRMGVPRRSSCTSSGGTYFVTRRSPPQRTCRGSEAWTHRRRDHTVADGGPDVRVRELVHRAATDSARRERLRLGAPGRGDRVLSSGRLPELLEVVNAYGHDSLGSAAR